MKDSRDTRLKAGSDILLSLYFRQVTMKDSRDTRLKEGWLET